jgi:hypothetical protein
MRAMEQLGRGMRRGSGRGLQRIGGDVDREGEGVLTGMVDMDLVGGFGR